LANNPHGGEHLKDLLVGQILWVSPAQLWTAAIASSGLLAVIAWRGERLTGLAFYAVFALAITITVQLIGVYLVFTSLIVPALATTGMHGRWRWAVAYSIGATGYVTGLVLSAVLDLPSGAMIVWTLALSGLLAQLLPLRRAQRQAALEGEA
jgi:zinc/manganese transport system permease protein